ncbi:MAG TPA: serine hydrolase domain-containing protein, partial [Candidatus Binataceae bacterium]|nr:serine hydrolase domain-containing protein [Candidatus Binataceae bacterium]
MGWREVERSFSDAVERRVFPGATVIARRGDQIVFEGAFGFRTLIPEPRPMTIDTVFDLSSLTKVLATTIIVMMLAREARLRLDDKVTRFFPDFGVHGKGRVTFRHLLAHCSGLAAWRPYYNQIADIEKSGKVNFMSGPGAKQMIFEAIHREKPEAEAGA